MPILPQATRRHWGYDLVVGWCRSWIGSDAAGASQPETGEKRFHAEPAVRNPDPTLLLRRMAVLHLDPVTFAREQPVKFRVLQGLCARCETPEQCAHDLADGSADPGWQDWRDYCRNAPVLSALSALEWSGSGSGTDAHPVSPPEKAEKPGLAS